MPAPTSEEYQRISSRLEQLCQHHLRLDDVEGIRYYIPGRGYVGHDDGGARGDQFGIALTLLDGRTFRAGDAELPFPLQSISKVFSYALALADHDREYVLRRVGVEPSGDAYNSLSLDEHNNRPFNPMVNAGALATTAMIRGNDQGEKLDRVLDLLRSCAGNDSLAVDEATFDAELDSADRNRATAYLMRSDGMLSGDVESTLALYLRQCAVAITCQDLATMAATIANGAVNPLTGRRALPRDRVRDVISVMHTCGMYDYAGEWAYSIGVPAKSGVSGGLLVVIPGKMGIGVFSPGLDRFGNSVRGTRVCQEISEELRLHVFATEGEDRLVGTAST